MNMFSKKRSTVSNFQRLSIKENQQDSSCAFVKGRTSRIQDKNSEAVCSAPESVAKAPFTLHRKNLKLQQSPVNLDLCLDLCLGKTRSGKSHYYCDACAIVIEKLCFHNVFFGTRT